jgi:hypothetical protein
LGNYPKHMKMSHGIFSKEVAQCKRCHKSMNTVMIRPHEAQCTKTVPQQLRVDCKICFMKVHLYSIGTHLRVKHKVLSKEKTPCGLCGKHVLCQILPYHAEKCAVKLQTKPDLALKKYTELAMKKCNVKVNEEYKSQDLKCELKFIVASYDEDNAKPMTLKNIPALRKLKIPMTTYAERSKQSVDDLEFHTNSGKTLTGNERVSSVPDGEIVVKVKVENREGSDNVIKGEVPDSFGLEVTGIRTVSSDI